MIQTKTEYKKDLDLSELHNFIGTERYYNIMGTNVTDGVYYVMESGYSWAVTDAIAILKFKLDLQKYPFIAIKLKVEDKKAVITYEDGNGKVLYTQRYEYTDARKDIIFFFMDNVLMLNNEY